MAYKPHPPPWMPGNEALSHIQRVEGCGEAEAIQQLRDAIVDKAVGARLPTKTKRLPIGSSPISVPSDSSFRSSAMWKSAEILFDGTVRFDPTEKAIPFEVIRQNILRIWNVGELNARLAAHKGKRVQRRRPAQTKVLSAINKLWPNGIPESLMAKERDQKILAQIELDGSKTYSEAGLKRTIQRVLQQQRLTIRH